MSWATDLNRLANKGKHDLGELAKAVKIQLFGQVTMLTRVDTGRLRGNWQISEGHPARMILNVADKTGNNAKARDKGYTVIDVNRELKKPISAAGITYITNHLPYAKVWEEKDAMVGRTVAIVRKAVKDEIKRLRG